MSIPSIHLDECCGREGRIVYMVIHEYALVAGSSG
jgi:hypothetical protein